MRVLAGILAYQLDSETLRSIHTQEWDDAWDILTLWGGDMQPGEDRFQAVTRKYQRLQRTFLAGPWDALLTVEQDMYLPPNALRRLTRLARDGADISYGLYVWRYQEQHWWNAHPKIAADDAGVPWFWSMTQYPAEARRLWGRPVEIQGLGLGCTLITKRALTHLGFRQSRADHCCDTTLALDAIQEGLIQVADLGVVCGHKIDAEHVIYPDPEQDTLYRIDTI